MSRICSIEDCGRNVLARGWCSRHYANWRRTGDPIPRQRIVGQGLEARLWHRTKRVQKDGVEGECWVFEGAVTGRGRDGGNYRGVRLDNGGPYVSAHRAAYLTLVGPIPDGWHVHHLCGTKECWRPEHLEALSASDHMTLHHAEEKMECKNGHAFTPENTYLQDQGFSKPTKVCRACRNESMRRYRERRA